MRFPFGRKCKVGLRFGACLLIAACSQSALETYGCACASRTYTQEEIAGYRAGAARGDHKALAEMQEYHMWRQQDQPADSAEYQHEKELERSFFERRIELNDPEALEEKIGMLLQEAWFEKSLTEEQRRSKLLKAREYAARAPQPLTMFDYRDDDRAEITVHRYIERELRMLL